MLEQIPSLFGQSQVVGSCLGGAVDACIQLLKLGTGGKLHVFASALPKTGKAALTQRAEQTGDKDLQKVQEPAVKAYREMAADAAEFQVCIAYPASPCLQTCDPPTCLRVFSMDATTFYSTKRRGTLRPNQLCVTLGNALRLWGIHAQISIDLFVMAQAYIDLATLRELCQQTAGQLYYYSNFVPEIDADQLQNDLRWNAMRPQVGSVLHHACSPLLAGASGEFRMPIHISATCVSQILGI